MPASPTLAELVAHRGAELLRDSHVNNQTFAQWERARRFLAALIDRPGALLDIGCANGFLLRCLADWALVPFAPHGIDVDARLVAAAQALHPAHAGHFVRANIVEFARLPALGLPARFDVVFWNVWDNVRFEPAALDRLDELVHTLVAPGGRAILAFYNQDRSRSHDELDRLSRRFSLGGPVWSPGGGPEVAVTIDRPT